jgi:hypothetical protein
MGDQTRVGDQTVTALAQEESLRILMILLKIYKKLLINLLEVENLQGENLCF